MAPIGQRFLIIYSGLLTVVLAVILLVGYPRLNPTDFEEITVQRINVVEPDGTLRMILSNHDRLPGIIVRGKERSYDRPQAGMVFYNDEGSEIGGLIFGGYKNAEGNVMNSGGSLSFDRYEANQIVQLLGVDDSENHFAGLIVADSHSGTENYRRIWVGRNQDGSAGISLMDLNGKTRITLEVSQDGTPSLQFLDADGTVINQIRP